MIAVDRAAGGAAMRGLMRDGERAAARAPDRDLPRGHARRARQRAAVAARHRRAGGRTGLPVIPVVTDSGRLWGRRAFRKRPGMIRIAILPPMPRRLPRAELLQRLEAIYRAGVPVDNSVGSAPDLLADSASGKREPLDPT